MLQPGRGLVVEKVFQLAKESSSWLENLFLKLVGKLFQRGFSELLSTLANLKPFRRRLLELVATLAGWKIFSTMNPRANCNLSCLENLFDVECSSWLLPRRKGFPTSQGSNQLEDSFVEKVPTSQGSKHHPLHYWQHLPPLSTPLTPPPHTLCATGNTFSPHLHQISLYYGCPRCFHWLLTDDDAVHRNVSIR